MKTNPIYSFFEKYSFLLPLGVVLLTLAMLGLTLFPTEFIGDSRIWSYDKLGHLAMFGGWTYTLGLYHHIIRDKPTRMWVIFLIGVLFGLAIELLQHWLPLNRHGDIIDLLFDATGCLIAIFLLNKTVPKK